MCNETVAVYTKVLSRKSGVSQIKEVIAAVPPRFNSRQEYGFSCSKPTPRPALESLQHPTSCDSLEYGLKVIVSISYRGKTYVELYPYLVGVSSWRDIRRDKLEKLCIILGRLLSFISLEKMQDLRGKVYIHCILYTAQVLNVFRAHIYLVCYTRSGCVQK
jgi:hypothetical protein